MYAEDTIFDKVADFNIRTGMSADYRTLVEEELFELEAALSEHERFPEWSDGKANVAKEMCDVFYVCIGWAIQNSVDLEEAFNRVHESNMSKLVNGKVIKNEKGKVTKGPNYKPPVLHDLIKGEYPC